MILGSSTVSARGALAGAAALAAALLLVAGASAAEARPKCGGKKATIVGSNGRDVIRAPKKGPQVIHARGGDDRIVAKRGRDIVCGGPGADVISAGTGRDKVFGGPGADFLDLGPGKDKGFGGGSADTIVGGASGDTIRGGSSPDRLFGGIQDDKMFGDSGDDLVVGGHGIDKMRGGAGSDWLRGDTNRDRYFGDSGADTLSFATATPPGPHPTRGGVDVDLRSGTARGDDSAERIFGIENLVGSRFDDILVGGGGGWVRGGGGSDDCSGFASADCPKPGGQGATVAVRDGDSPDPGLVLLGGDGGDAWTISRAGGGYLVSGSGLTVGHGCAGGGGGITCAAPAPIGYVLAWGGDGADSITIGGGIPGSTLVKVDGGPGSDILRGSRRDELLYAGETGADVLIGGGGDDALVSRGGGADRLFGGKGNDQLVTNDPCGGHVYSGGPGKADVAGFAHTDTRGVKAKLGGKARLRGARCAGTRIRGNHEVLEGTRFPDVLLASRRSDLLIGREGRDRCRGGRRLTC